MSPKAQPQHQDSKAVSRPYHVVPQMHMWPSDYSRDSVFLGPLRNLVLSRLNSVSLVKKFLDPNLDTSSGDCKVCGDGSCHSGLHKAP
jgi:hypothetical protein